MAARNSSFTNLRSNLTVSEASPKESPLSSPLNLNLTDALRLLMSLAPTAPASREPDEAVMVAEAMAGDEEVVEVATVEAVATVVVVATVEAVVTVVVEEAVEAVLATTVVNRDIWLGIAVEAVVGTGTEEVVVADMEAAVAGGTVVEAAAAAAAEEAATAVESLGILPEIAHQVLVEFTVRVVYVLRIVLSFHFNMS